VTLLGSMTSAGGLYTAVLTVTDGDGAGTTKYCDQYGAFQ